MKFILWLLGIYAVISSIIIITLVTQNSKMKTMLKEYQRPEKVIDWQSKHILNTNDAPQKGNPEAEVSIVVFSDFECPSCADAAKILNQIQQKFPQQVKIYFKNFPLPHHEMAFGAATAAMAANEQGRFWEMHDLLYDSNNHDYETVLSLANSISLDLDVFQEAWGSESIIEHVKKDISEGQTLQIDGTPAIFVNGIQAVKISEDELTMIINKIMNQVGNGDKR